MNRTEMDNAFREIVEAARDCQAETVDQFVSCVDAEGGRVAPSMDDLETLQRTPAYRDFLARVRRRLLSEIDNPGQCIGRPSLRTHTQRWSTAMHLVCLDAAAQQEVSLNQWVLQACLAALRRPFFPTPQGPRYPCGCEVFIGAGDSHEHPTISVCPKHGA